MSEIVKVTAICSRSIDYREYDRLLELISLEQGKITAVIRGVKKPTAKLKYASRPFCFGNYMLAKTNGRYTVCDLTEIENFSELSDDLEKFYAASAMLELLSKTLAEGQANAEAVIATIKALKAICFEQKQPFAALNEAIIEILRSLGFELNFDFCASCGSEITGRAFFTEQSGVLCEACFQPYSVEFSKNDLESLKNPDGKAPQDIKMANIKLLEIVYILTNVKLKSLKTAY